MISLFFQYLFNLERIQEGQVKPRNRYLKEKDHQGEQFFVCRVYTMALVSVVNFFHLLQISKSTQQASECEVALELYRSYQ